MRCSDTRLSGMYQWGLNGPTQVAVPHRLFLQYFKFLYDAELLTEASLEAQFSLRRANLKKNYAMLDDNFAGQICREYQDGLRACAESHITWPLRPLDGNICPMLLQYMRPNSTASSTSLTTDSPSSTTPATDSPFTELSVAPSTVVEGQDRGSVVGALSTPACDGSGVLFMEFLSVYGIWAGFLLGLSAYVFYVMVGSPLWACLKRVRQYISQQSGYGARQCATDQASLGNLTGEKLTFCNSGLESTMV